MKIRNFIVGFFGIVVASLGMISSSEALGAGSFLVIDRAALPVLDVMSAIQPAPSEERVAFIRNPRPRISARHRHTHDLFVEVFDPKIEITGTEHLRHPCGFRLVRCAGAHPSAPTVDQPILPALLESVAQAPETALAEPKKLSSFDTTQASRPMRTDRIQNSRHPNLRQHATLRSKNRTNHVLPKPDISCARDTLSDKELARIESLLNNRPRKRLGFRTPHEVFTQSMNPVALRS